MIITNKPKILTLDDALKTIEYMDKQIKVLQSRHNRTLSYHYENLCAGIQNRPQNCCRRDADTTSRRVIRNLCFL